MRFHSVLVEGLLEFISVMTNSHRAGINVNVHLWHFGIVHNEYFFFPLLPRIFLLLTSKSGHQNSQFQNDLEKILLNKCVNAKITTQV